MRIAVAGCGSAGSRHAFNLVAMGHTAVLFDPDANKARSLAVEVGSGRCTVVGSTEELWEAAPDACVVATPTDTHAALATAALERGIPVFVEKPLALTYQEGAALARKQAETTTPLMVGYNLRFVKEIADVKRRLEQGEIGDPLGASFWFGYDLRKWRKGVDYKTTYSARKQRGGGILLEASHEIDLAFWLLGPFDTTYGIVRRTGVIDADPEDLAVALVQARCGAVASFFLEMVSATYRRGFEVVGEKGSLGWRWLGTSRSRHAIDNSYREELTTFLSCIQSGRTPAPGASDGIYVLGAIEAIDRSSALCEPVKVPPPAAEIGESR